MKRIYIILMLLSVTLWGMAQQQDRKRFSPEKFDAELQQFIVQEAHLTPQESARFFPVFKEMQRKQRMLYHRKRMISRPITTSSSTSFQPLRSTTSLRPKTFSTVAC